MPVRMMMLMMPVPSFPEENRPSQNYQHNQTYRAENNQAFTGSRGQNPP
jgi:hypothetical protein